ncbi:MAG TPA: hypothetical protein VHL11_15985 [Phototrophicaceae bacterium]|jgi:Tol biopolymer transport system component|nr:hypothetical protein [Phototrophicaceae bacterium]
MTRLAFRLTLWLTICALPCVIGIWFIGQILPHQNWDVMAYLSERQLYLRDFIHRLVVPLNSDEKFYTQPNWSSDGNDLAVLAGDGSGDRLKVTIFDIARRNSRTLTSVSLENQFYLAPKWSPDGAYLAYSTLVINTRNYYALYVVKPNHLDVSTVADTEPQFLVNYNIPSGFWGAEANGAAVTWSKDSHFLILTAAESSLNVLDPLFYTTSLYEISVEGGDMHAIRDDVQNIIAPAVSPDGKQITFISNWDTNILRLYVMNRDGSDLRQLDNIYYETLPAWSRDGLEIGYWLREANQTRFYTINLSAGAKHRLYEFAESIIFPIWRP